MILSTSATHIVNDMLQGELAATETYQQALAQVGNEPGAEDVRHSKPAPEPYLAAMEHLSARASGLRPADCLVFEDSVPGIASARAAGMKVVGVTNSYPAAKLGAAHRVVDSLEGLTPAELLSLFAV